MYPVFLLLLGRSVVSDSLVIYPTFLWLSFGHSFMLDSLRPHGPQQARLPCPSLSPGALLKLMSSESVMPSNHLILCCPHLLYLQRSPSELCSWMLFPVSLPFAHLCAWPSPFVSYDSSPPPFSIPKGLIAFWYSPLHFFSYSKPFGDWAWDGTVIP